MHNQIMSFIINEVLFFLNNLVVYLLLFLFFGSGKNLQPNRSVYGGIVRLLFKLGRKHLLFYKFVDRIFLDNKIVIC